MILVLAGTLDGRELAMRLAASGYDVLVSVVSDYGRSLADAPGITVHTGQLDLNGLRELITSRSIKAVVDASHPYAVNVSLNAMAACAASCAKYIRYERDEVITPAYDRLYRAGDAAEAAKLAAGLGKVIFLTTGSRTLKIFKTEPLLTGCRLIARVLPQPDVLAECIALGFSPGDIVAVKGPFSHQLNVALFTEYAAEVIVTKNSGTVGGADTKISAAVELGLPLVVIGRPDVEYRNLCRTQEAVLALLT
ncbi:Cobalt-precorrin-6A reductase [Sporomusa carbonis]|uniref:precorrin-6A reductase n=1 Tax=Sporomusa carbonis TaxID=3076075 RepID=UPI003A666B4F